MWALEGSTVAPASGSGLRHSGDVTADLAASEVSDRAPSPAHTGLNAHRPVDERPMIAFRSA
jgi:hypothetical protein